MQIGASSNLTFDGKSLKTATEARTQTYQMRNSIVSLVEQSPKELCVSCVSLVKGFIVRNPELDDISVNLDDGVFYRPSCRA